MRLIFSLYQSTFLLFINVRPFFKAGCYLVVACVIMQSTLVMPASIKFDANVEQYTETVLPFSSIISGNLSENNTDLTQTVLQEDCLDCNTKTCQCCSTTLCIFTLVLVDINAFSLSFHRYQTSQTAMFYDLLLRPPKVSTLYSS